MVTDENEQKAEYFVDLREREENQKYWQGRRCWMCQEMILHCECNPE